MTKKQLELAKKANEMYAKKLGMSYKDWLVCHLELAKEQVKNGRKECQIDIDFNEALLNEIE